MPQPASGAAMSVDSNTSTMNSRERRNTRWGTLAPSTLRMPISRVRWLAVKAARPKRPDLFMHVSGMKIFSNPYPRADPPAKPAANLLPHRVGRAAEAKRLCGRFIDDERPVTCSRFLTPHGRVGRVEITACDKG